MKNRKRVWVPLLVLLLVAAIWYSRPVTLPDLLKNCTLCSFSNSFPFSFITAVPYAAASMPPVTKHIRML